MERYQIIIHLISCNFVTNPLGQTTWGSYSCFLYLSHAYFGGLVIHAPCDKINGSLFVYHSKTYLFIVIAVL
jgi:hypothetical protein